MHGYDEDLLGGDRLLRGAWNAVQRAALLAAEQSGRLELLHVASGSSLRTLGAAGHAGGYPGAADGRGALDVG